MNKTKSQCCHTADACAVAAAKGAALMLREQQIVDEVEIILPASETARFRLHGQKIVGDTASCYVIGDSCDDHDTTDGAEVHVSIKVDFFAPRRILLAGMPDADQAGDEVGDTENEGDIAPVPQLQILEVVREVFAMRCMPSTLTVTVGMSGE
ncbi:MAG TPA: cobalt-precorrin-5B (C(1))-methyltransferase [Geobacteraceae bacterium]|nr:cobalt-precorrin-5B (C(1))-methyltransferase [Geobacteraceae bacterium]